jgi:hypothetical protein
MSSFLELAAAGPPQVDQVEISVFGPNFGECVVVHLGNGHWIVIDSCIYEPTKEPVALAYLRALALDPAESIKAVIATHWHDDHCKGLGSIISAAPGAHIWIASALTDREFLRFSARMNKNTTAVAGTKLSEFDQIIESILTRRNAGLLTYGFVTARMSIYRVDASVSGHGHSCEILALSPSHGDELNFRERIARDSPQRRQTKRSVPSPEPNDISIATMVSIGPTSAILGADLENAGSTAGWQAVISSHAYSPLVPRACLYKLPHHGSENAHNVEVWQQLLTPEPLAVLTPWRKGRGRLPSSSGIRLIATQTPTCYITASDARTQKVKRRPPGVSLSLRENRSIRLRSLEAPFGAVRFRSVDLTNGTWKHELFGDACDVRKLRRIKQVR